MFHNIRDKYGRFKPKGKSSKKNKAKSSNKKQFDTVINAFLLDDSGSMSGKETGVVEGFNELIKSGRQDAARTGIKSVESVAFFSGNGQFQFIPDVKGLVVGSHGSKATGHMSGDKHYFSASGGMTALYDSVADLIEKATAIQKQHTNSNVILTVFTDGGENDSKRWSQERLKDLIERKQSEGWVITYVGAEASLAQSQSVAKGMGIFASNATNYVNTSAGTQSVVSKVSASRSSYLSKSLVGEATMDGFFEEK